MRNYIMSLLKKCSWLAPAVTLVLCLFAKASFASEIDLKIPMLDIEYQFGNFSITGSQILGYGLIICALGMLFGFYEFCKIKKMPAHKSMLNMASLIYETCKTYMKQQAVLLVILGFDYFDVVRPRYSRLIYRCLVRYAHQHLSQRPHGFCFVGRKSISGNELTAPLGNVYRRIADLR